MLQYQLTSQPPAHFLFSFGDRTALEANGRRGGAQMRLTPLPLSGVHVTTSFVFVHAS